jgi:phospholipid/cholesterol/gamma-HCH transport system substrate-binding protein
MENKAHAMAAGIFVVALVAILIALAAWLTRDTGVRDVYEISTNQTVTGLQEQAPVRFRGVDVGKVAKIGFDQAASGNVLVKLEIDHEAPLTQKTFAVLNQQGVTGLAYIQLDDEAPNAPRLAPNNDKPPRIPLKPGLLAKLEERGEAILTKVDEVAGRINSLLNDDNQKRFASAMSNIDRAAASTQQLAERLDRTVATKLDPALAEAGPTLKSVRNSADEISRTAADFGRTARRLNEKDGPMDRLAEGSQALSHAADSFNAATLPRINRVTEDTSRAARQLSRAVTGISDNPQSLIWGTGRSQPGPGEPGFTPPRAGQ